MSMRSWCLPLCAASAGALLPAASPATASAHTYTVVIDKLKFGPLPAQLHKGDTIIWVNRDFLRHSATAANHAFDVDLPANTARKMRLTKSGSFPFTCRYHPGMRGTLVIK